MNNIKKDFLTYLVNSGRFVNEFGRFSPAYTISNECLSEAMEVIDNIDLNNNSTVLLVPFKE